MNLQLFQEQIFFSTVRISVSDQTGAGASIGTGFLYREDLNEKSAALLLISNKHVYQNPNHQIALTFHKRDPNDLNRPLLGPGKTFVDTNFIKSYREHPDPNVDLACINVSMIGRPQLGIYVKFLGPELFGNFNHDRLLPGNEVWFVGYPEGRFDTKHNLPLLRRGYIASIPKVDYEGRKEFLIDAQVFPGSSGSPVFTTLGSKYQFIGVVTQTMIRNQRLQSVATVDLGVPQIIGLGIVIKAPLVMELIEHTLTGIRASLAKNQSEPTEQNPGPSPSSA